MTTASWTLESIGLSNVLGFCGDLQRPAAAPGLAFEDGVNVVHAPNHTGKTSLAIALLWGLTGRCPDIDRINKVTFRLRNRHAPAGAESRVTLALRRTDGLRLLVDRVHGGARNGTPALRITLGSEGLTGDAAQSLLDRTLRLSAGGIEGTGVVLQDHRLRLVTRTTELREVVSEVLGLAVLSELAPQVNERKKAAQALVRELAAYRAGGDPLSRWRAKNEELDIERRRRRDAAGAAGCSPEALDAPAALVEAELAACANTLGMPVPDTAEHARAIAAVASELSRQRAGTKTPAEIAELELRRTRVAALRPHAERAEAQWRGLAAAFEAAATEGVLEEAAHQHAVRGGRERLAANQVRREELHAEERLLTAAHSYVAAHPDATSCPVCEQAVPAATLARAIAERLGTRVATELEELAADDAETRLRVAKAETRLRDLAGLRDRLDDGCRSARALADGAQGAGLAIDAPAPETAALLADPAALPAWLAACERLAIDVDATLHRLAERIGELTAAQARAEAERFGPIQARLDRVRSTLLPLVEADERLARHGALRDVARERGDALDVLEREAEALGFGLDELRKALAVVEESRAREAIEPCSRFAASFFARVARNPDFTGLEVGATVKARQVQYALTATSTRTRGLDDAAGHVLSGGDLSAAALGFLLGLVRSRTHDFATVVLDDPAEGMDETMQRNLAAALGEIEDVRQVIVLTHQDRFAAALAARGARVIELGRWEGGRLVA